LDFQLRNIFIAAELETGSLFPSIAPIDLGQLLSQITNQFGHMAEKMRLQLN